MKGKIAKYILIISLLLLKTTIALALHDSIRAKLPDTININNPYHILEIAALKIADKELNIIKPLLDHCISISNKQRNNATLAKAYFYLADHYFNIEEYDNSLKCFTDNLVRLTQLGDTLFLIKSNAIIGLIHHLKHRNEVAMDQFLKTLELIDQYSQKDDLDVKQEKLVVMINSNALFSETSENMKVIEYAEQIIALAGEINDSLRMGSAMNTLAMAYAKLGQYKEAHQTYLKSADIFKKLNNDYRLSFVINNLGILFDKTQNYDSALHYLYISLEGFKKSGYNIGVARNLNAIASVLKKTNKTKEAREVYNQIIDMGTDESHYYNLLLVYKELAELEYSEGNHKLAYEFLEKHKQLNDTIFSDQKQRQLNELQTIFDTKQKEAEILNLKTEKHRREIILKLNQRLVWFGFSIALIVIIFALVFFAQLNEKRRVNARLESTNIQIEKQNKQLQQLNTEMQEINQKLHLSEDELSDANKAQNRFFNILAHDLRGPFHVILGQSGLLSSAYEILSEDERKQYASDINASCENVNRLLENLLEWSRSQSKGISFNPKAFNLKEMVQNTIVLLRKNASRKNISIINEAATHTDFKADYPMLETILRNLVGNAIKFTPEGGYIRISSMVQSGMLTVCIEDNGIGISNENMEKLFKIDSNIKTPGTCNEKGTGLGLVICKDFVEHHQGKIWAESTEGKGSMFFFTIPKLQA